MKKFISLMGIIAMTVFTSMASDGEKPVKVVNNTIVDVAAQSDFLSILVKAIHAGELSGILEGEGPYTLFAPTNEAFDNLPVGIMEELLKPENKARLQAILKNHVVSGRIMAEDLSNGQIAESMNNGKLNFSKSGSQFLVNGARITTADMEASNGVIHVVNKVLLPTKK